MTGPDGRNDAPNLEAAIAALQPLAEQLGRTRVVLADLVEQFDRIGAMLAESTDPHGTSGRGIGPFVHVAGGLPGPMISEDDLERIREAAASPVVGDFRKVVQGLGLSAVFGYPGGRPADASERLRHFQRGWRAGQATGMAMHQEKLDKIVHLVESDDLAGRRTSPEAVRWIANGSEDGDGASWSATHRGESPPSAV